MSASQERRDPLPTTYTLTTQLTGADDEVDENGIPYFSYASPEDSRLRRLAITLIERITGQPKLKAMYLKNRREPREGESFWDAAMRYLELHLNFDRTRLEQIPQTGPLVVVANHPYGVLDGIVISWLISQVRTDFKVLTNSVLFRAPEIRPFVLPIDFAETREAMATNLNSRAEARAILKDGGAIVAFPGGTVSTADKPLTGRAVDPDWKPFTARLIIDAQATVVPIFFSGQNSRLFQIASLLSPTLRIALLFHEVARRIRTKMDLTIGAPIPYADLAHIKDRRALADHLRSLTYALETSSTS